MKVRKSIIGVVAILTAAVGIFLLWSIAPVVGRQSGVLSNTRIVARDGSVLYEISPSDDGRRNPVPLEAMSQSFKNAVIATEDVRFYRHPGADVLAVARAVGTAAATGRAKSGASTIEMQLVKNLYFQRERRTVLQKLREVPAALYWDLTHRKEDTLALYLNTVYLGNQNSGVEAAARQYFHKSASDLSLPESALLAGMIAAPSAYDPFGHWDAARKRQRYVLDRMFEEGMISASERDEASGAEIEVFPPRHTIRAPHFVFRVLEELEERYPDIRGGGYVVRTTLDPELQEVAERSVRRRLATLADDHVTNASVLAVGPLTGEVLAYVGSAEYFDSSIQGQVDIVQAKRQPGSALKPFMYFTAFLRGFTPATVIADLPVRFETADDRSYYPKNYNYRYFGPVTIRDALGSSLNIPAVKVLDEIGLPVFAGVLARFGITFPEAPDYYGLGMVLGGAEVSLSDATNAYASLARAGRSVSMKTVLDIQDARGQTVESGGENEPETLFDDETRAAQAAILISDILSDRLARVLSFGESNLLDLEKPIAVKTGTTKDFRDNWAFGYTPEFVLGVWVGNADNTPMEGVSGITGAVPVWRDIMKHVTDRKDIVWPMPEGIVEREICITSGLLANGVCPKTRVEKFIVGTEPTLQDDWYVSEAIDARSGLAATAACSGNTIQKIFLRPPSQYAAWLVSANTETPPDRDCEGNLIASENRAAAILSPLDGDEFVLDDLIDGDGQRISFIAGGGSGSDYHWTLNGRALSSGGPVCLWEPQPGDYTLTLEGADDEIRFSVR